MATKVSTKGGTDTDGRGISDLRNRLEVAEWMGSPGGRGNAEFQFLDGWLGDVTPQDAVQALDMLPKSGILKCDLARFPGWLPRCPSLVRLNSKSKP